MENVREKLAPLFDAPHLNCDERECLLNSYADTPADELKDQLRRASYMLDGFIYGRRKGGLDSVLPALRGGHQSAEDAGTPRGVGKLTGPGYP